MPNKTNWFSVKGRTFDGGEFVPGGEPGVEVFFGVFGFRAELGELVPVVDGKFGSVDRVAEFS